MKVPLLDLKAQYAIIKDDIRRAVDEVMESQYFILGPKVEELEKRVASYSETKYAVGVSSGTDALLAALMAAHVGPGDEVITSPFTFFSTAGVIARLGARPVFVDIDPVTYNIDPGKIEAAVTPRTKALIPVHLFGQCADMDPIMESAGNHNLVVIEDAAQSIGAEYKGRKAGSVGHIGTFSFFPSKNLGGFGDGGMIVTQDETLHEMLHILRVHGSKPKYFHKVVGGNFRLDALQAAVLLVKLGHLDAWSQKRRENAGFYDRTFAASGLVESGHLTRPVSVYKESGDRNHHIYNQYTIRTGNPAHRDPLRAFLGENGIGTEIYYPLPLHIQECFRDLGYKAGDFPATEAAAACVLSLPIYPELTEGQQNYVVEKILEFFQTHAGGKIQ
jgi:dTDP-4-amino-4,6-dideoxygalactose transaminase